MVEQENLKLVQTIVGEYKKVNVKAPAPDCLAEGVHWVVSGAIDDPFTGEYYGREQVEQLFAKFNELVEPELHEPKEYIVQGDKVVVRGYEKVRFKFSGRSLECSFVYIYTVRQGQIVDFHAMYGYP